MLSVTHIALENCPISKVTVDRDQRGDSGGAEQHGGGEAETPDEDGPEFFATTCLTGLCLLKCFARYIYSLLLRTPSSPLHLGCIPILSEQGQAQWSRILQM